jgi:hypothetical protein
MQVSVVCLLALGKLCSHPLNIATVMALCVPSIVHHLAILGRVSCIVFPPPSLLSHLCQVCFAGVAGSLFRPFS